MVSLLLAFLFTVHHMAYPSDMLTLPVTQQLSAVDSFLYNQIDPPFRISNGSSPIRREPLYVFPPFLLTARSGVVIDDASGLVLWSKDADKAVPIASLTKLMSALVVLDQSTDFQQEVRMVRQDESAPAGSRLVVSPGEIVRVADLFSAMLVGSANNATNALVRSTGLSADAFVHRMNEKAGQLGLLHTTFFDPTGLDPRNVSTAKEYGKLAGYAFRNATIMEALSSKAYAFETVGRHIRHTIRNTNQLLNDPQLGKTVAKTGYLEEAGFTLALRGRVAGDRSALVTLFDSETSDARFSEAKALLAWLGQTYEWY